MLSHAGAWRGDVVLGMISGPEIGVVLGMISEPEIGVVLGMISEPEIGFR
jgi:hypothetical protein